MTLLIWQCSKDSDSPLQQPCCFYFILYSYFIVVVSFFSNVFKGMYKVNILCIHSLICPLLYFKLKYIQSSPSLVLNSGISITWKLNEEDFWIFPPGLHYRIKSWELQLSMCVLSMSMPYKLLQNKCVTYGINSVYWSEILWTVSLSL